MLKQFILVLITTLIVYFPAPAYTHPPRGMVLLGLTNKKFPVHKAAEALKASPRPAFAFIIKSFGKRYTNVVNLCTQLHEPVVVIYGDCGPCRPPRRPWGQFPLIEPHIDLRTLDSKLRRANPRTLERYRQEWDLAASQLPPGPKYVFVPQLEDQLSDKAYATLVRLYQEVFESRGDFRLVRNRQDTKLRGGAIEIHSADLRLISRLSHEDIVTLDGVPSTSLSAWLRGTKRAGVTALLWEPAWQGLSGATQLSRERPRDRTYKIPNLNRLKQLLRE